MARMPVTGKTDADVQEAINNDEDHGETAEHADAVLPFSDGFAPGFFG